MRILLTGSHGQLGAELRLTLDGQGELVAVGRSDCDLADSAALHRLLERARPDVIVNAAAYTAVDRAETEVDRSFAVNAGAPGLMGEWAAAKGVLVVHYSSDYVFDGRKASPYLEDDPTDPLGVYGRSKLEGEHRLRHSGARHLVLRTSWVAGAHGGNFARTILRLAGEQATLRVVADQIGAPTTTGLIAQVTRTLIARARAEPDRPLGLYHLAAAGETSWYEYARLVVRTAHEAGFALRATPDAIVPIRAAEYPLPARRPANSRLDTRRLREHFGIELPDWQAGIRHLVAELAESNR